MGMLAGSGICVRPASAEGMLENWYMNRGKSNMQIGNYKAAIEAYEKATAINQDNREAMRNLGLAYEAQGLKDKAVEQYDRYLERYPDDSEIAFKQAETLGWSRYSYRKQDALKYYRLGLSHKDNTKMRLRYARLLAANKSTNDEAIAQYERVLAHDPDNSEAHRGLAKAYAWKGENDRALYHGARATGSNGRTTADLTKLERDLSVGREPRIEGRFRLLTQSGEDYKLGGFTASAFGKRDLTPFVTASAEAGAESYWNDMNSSQGLFFAGTGQVRFDPRQRVDVEIGYHVLPVATRTGTSSRTTASTAGTVVGKIQYGYDGYGYSIRPGFKRVLKEDSLLSLAGSGSLGAARSNLLYVELETVAGPFTLNATPYGGWVSSASLANNEVMGADARASLPLLLTNGGAQVELAHVMQLEHYGSDQSGLRSGGYFSPQFYMNQNPRLEVNWNFGSMNELNLGGGPELQYVKDANDPGSWKFGGNAEAAFGTRFRPNLRWKLSADYGRVSDIYDRFSFETALTYVF